MFRWVRCVCNVSAVPLSSRVAVAAATLLTACVRGSTQASRGRPARGGGRVSSVSIDRDCMCGPGSTAGVDRVPLSSKMAVADAMVLMSCDRGGAHASSGRRARGDWGVASVFFTEPGCVVQEGRPRTRRACRCKKGWKGRRRSPFWRGAGAERWQAGGGGPMKGGTCEAPYTPGVYGVAPACYLTISKIAHLFTGACLPMTSLGDNIIGKRAASDGRIWT